MAVNVQDELESLKSLELIFAERGKSNIKGLCKQESLAFLRIWGLGDCACLEGISCLSNLQVLDLGDFPGDTLPDFSGLANLRMCCTVNSIVLKDLHRLTDLDVDFGGFQIINISGCYSLRKVWGLRNNTQLKKLCLSSCWEVNQLPALYRCRQLTVLNISGCPKIREVPRLASLKELEELDISGCTSMMDLSNLRSFKTLKVLRAVGCDNLAQWPDWSKFEVFEKLVGGPGVRLLQDRDDVLDG